jgi:hypothetical protein
MINVLQKKFNKNARYPRLDTVLMVEDFIEEHSGEFKIYQLWKELPKKTMYQTYKLIISYLVSINKIAIDSEEKIAYIWNSNYKRKEELKWA